MALFHDRLNELKEEIQELRYNPKASRFVAI